MQNLETTETTETTEKILYWNFPDGTEGGTITVDPKTNTIIDYDGSCSLSIGVLKELDERGLQCHDYFCHDAEFVFKNESFKIIADSDERGTSYELYYINHSVSYSNSLTELLEKIQKIKEFEPIGLVSE